MPSIEVVGKTIEEAIEKACQKLRVSREDLKIEIIQDDSTKRFGLIGGRKVKIKATVNFKLEESSQKAKQILESLVKSIVPSAYVEIKEVEIQNRIHLEIKGDTSGLLIGRHGKTLNALEYLVNKMANKNSNTNCSIFVDSSGYRQRRQRYLTNLARKLSEEAKRTNRPVSTDPLTSRERRIVHVVVNKDKRLVTYSEGEAELKRVVIVPKDEDG